MKQLGDKILITGGAEQPTEVEVAQFYQPDYTSHREISFIIRQGRVAVQISPETLQSIVDWYRETNVVIADDTELSSPNNDELPAIFGIKKMLVLDDQESE